MLASWLRPRFVAGGALTRNGRRNLAWGDAPQQRFLADQDWNTPNFVERYAGFFQSNYIAELLCRLAYLDPSPDDLASIQLPIEAPGFAVPPLLIHCTTTRLSLKHIRRSRRIERCPLPLSMYLYINQ